MTSCSSIEFNIGPEHYIRLSDIKRFAGDSGFTASISLRSGAFELHHHKFYFDDLDRFLADVRRLYDTLSGEAQLRAAFERNHLSISINPRGHVQVSGHFECFTGQTHRLEFEFTADQTYLPPFIRSLEKACRELYLKP